MASLVRLFSDYAYLISVQQRVNIEVFCHTIGHLTGIWKENYVFCRCERSVFFFFQLYNSLWVLACSVIPFHFFLSCVLCFQLLTPIFLKSFLTSSSHLTLGLPFGPVAYGFHLYMVLATFHWSFLLLQNYIGKIAAILHDGSQRESHKPHGPPTSVTWLLLLKRADQRWHVRCSYYGNALIHEFAHFPNLCEISLDSLTFPLPEAGGFLELILLYQATFLCNCLECRTGLSNMRICCFLYGLGMWHVWVMRGGV